MHELYYWLKNLPGLECTLPIQYRCGNNTNISDFCSLLFCLPTFKMNLVSDTDMIISAIHTITDLNQEVEVSNNFFTRESSRSVFNRIAQKLFNSLLNLYLLNTCFNCYICSSTSLFSCKMIVTQNSDLCK